MRLSPPTVIPPLSAALPRSAARFVAFAVCAAVFVVLAASAGTMIRGRTVINASTVRFVAFDASAGTMIRGSRRNQYLYRASQLFLSLSPTL